MTMFWRLMNTITSLEKICHKMNRYLQNSLWIIFFLTLVGVSKSFGQTVPANLEGKWKMDGKSVLKEMSPLNKEKYKKMSTDIRKKFERSLGSKIFLFSSEGVFQAEWGLGDKDQRVEGHFKVLKEEILNVDINGQEKEYLIEKLTSSELILSPRDNKAGVLLKLIFTRIP